MAACNDFLEVKNIENGVLYFLMEWFKHILNIWRNRRIIEKCNKLMNHFIFPEHLREEFRNKHPPSSFLFPISYLSFVSFFFFFFFLYYKNIVRLLFLWSWVSENQKGFSICIRAVFERDSLDSKSEDFLAWMYIQSNGFKYSYTNSILVMNTNNFQTDLFNNTPEWTRKKCYWRGEFLLPTDLELDFPVCTSAES